MSKKIMAKWLLVLGLSALYTVNTFAAAVTDVASTHWAYNSIVDIEKRGFMSLNSAGNFFPSATMNYFEVADVMAKATGYVDVEVNKNIDETFKNQIINNYNKQKPILDTYAKKYSAWDKSYNQQVAYLLGRGYMSESDLESFVTSAGKQTMTKQDLAVLIVRYLGKETTAKNTYKSTGYADESSIKEANRPHVAYLKSLGLIGSTEKFTPNTKVTRALCAKMFSDAVAYKEKQNTSAAGNATGSNASASTASEQVTVKKVLTKNASEYYVSLVRGSNTSYYTIKNTVQVLDAQGKAVNVLDIPAESKATVTIALENGTEYVKSMRLISSNGNNAAAEETSAPAANTTLQTVSGTLLEPSSNGIIRLAMADGTIKVYILDANNLTFLNGVAASVDDIAVGDKVTLTLQGSTALKVQAASAPAGNTAGNTAANANSSTGNNANSNAGVGTSAINSGEITNKAFTAKGYVFTIQNNGTQLDVTVPSAAKVTRNSKNSEAAAVRIGDTVTFTKTDGVVTQVKAAGVKKSVEGTLNAFTISANPTLTVKTSEGLETYAVASDAEFYDQKTRKYVALRELHLGQSLGIVIDSKEVISVDIEAGSGAANCKATISEVGSGYNYIDVIMDYEPISGGSRVPKRIYVPIDLSIILNGKAQSRSVLEEGMELVITYEYLDDTAPQKILILE